MSDISAGMWMVLCVMVFVRMRQWDKRFSAMYEDLKQQISEEFDMSEWISVKDRLPELELAEAKANDIDILRCLAFIKNRRAQNGAYVGQAWFDGEYFIDSDCIILDVTHWMPLPQPPKGE